MANWTLSDIHKLHATGKIRGYVDTIKQPEICTVKPVKKCKPKKPENPAITSTIPPVLFIGVDSGTNTGLAVWNSPAKEFELISTVSIHKAMDIVKQYHSTHAIIVYVEDARQRKWFGDNSEAKKQGAGSVKRDAAIWEAFLQEHQIPYIMKHPIKGMTKLDKNLFKKMTGYTGLTSEHARDAAMMVFGL